MTILNLKAKSTALLLAAIGILPLVLTTGNSFAAPPADNDPACVDSQGRPLAINNAQVSQWKKTTKNQFLARAHVSGSITKLYPDHSGHAHFEIQMDQAGGDTLEVIYNLSFGAVSPQVGQAVEACGDYITSNAPAGGYPVSPDGAIIHWVHPNPQGKGHPSGFLEINDQLVGS